MASWWQLLIVILAVGRLITVGGLVTLELGEPVTLGVGQQDNLEVGRRVTVGVGQQDTLNVGREVTLGLRQQDTLDVGREVTLGVRQQDTLNARHVTLDMRGQITVALPCIIYQPNEKPRPSRPLPAAVQLRPRSMLPWTMYLVVTAGVDKDTHVGCIVIHATAVGTNVKVGLGGCRNAMLWNPVHSWPVLTPDLLSVYTITVTSAHKELTVSLTGIANHTVHQQLDTEAKSVLVAGQSGRVSIAFPPVHKEGSCIILGAECTDNAFTMRVNGSVLLRPVNYNQDPVYVFLKQSECLDDYIFGEIAVGKEAQGWAKLDVVYTRDATTHTVRAELDHTTVLSTTQPHRGRDCSDRWLRLGVTAARISFDCDPGDDTH